MSNLYGRIPTAEAFRILKKYFPDLKEKDFKRFAGSYKNDSNFFFYSPSSKNVRLSSKNIISCFEILNSCFESMTHGDKIFTEKYFNLVENQENHKNCFYVPEQSELLNYENEFYFADSSELKSLVELVMKNLKKLSFTPSYEDIALDILSPLKTEANLDEALLNLSRILNFSDDFKENNRLLEKISKRIKPVYEKTRMWFLCGFSPEEIGK